MLVLLLISISHFHKRAIVLSIQITKKVLKYWSLLPLFFNWSIAGLIVCLRRVLPVECRALHWLAYLSQLTCIFQSSIFSWPRFGGWRDCSKSCRKIRSTGYRRLLRPAASLRFFPLLCACPTALEMPCEIHYFSCLLFSRCWRNTLWPIEIDSEARILYLRDAMKISLLLETLRLDPALWDSQETRASQPMRDLPCT